MIFSEHECSVFFGCWLSSGQPADYLGHLSFDGTVAARSFNREFLPYSVPANGHSSYALRITDSEFVREHGEYRNKHYAPKKSPAGDIVHFLIRGHDIYHEILAVSFVAQKIPHHDVTDQRLRELIDAG